jgi:hypothetical protein
MLLGVKTNLTLTVFRREIMRSMYNNLTESDYKHHGRSIRVWAKIGLYVKPQSSADNATLLSIHKNVWEMCTNIHSV